jgi:hypothetical protein
VATSEERVKELEQALEEVLTCIRRQGHPNWQLNTCLVTDDELKKWWKILRGRNKKPQ